MLVKCFLYYFQVGGERGADGGTAGEKEIHYQYPVLCIIQVYFFSKLIGEREVLYLVIDGIVGGLPVFHNRIHPLRNIEAGHMHYISAIMIYDQVTGKRYENG